MPLFLPNIAIFVVNMKKTHLLQLLSLLAFVLLTGGCLRQSDRLSRVQALYEEATEKAEQHQVGEAISLLHQSLLLSDGRSDLKEMRLTVLSLLGDLYFEQKNYAESLPVYREFLSLCETDRQKSIALHDLSSYYVMTEQPDSALFYAHRSLSHALADGDSLKIAYRLHSLALAHNVFQQPDSALLYARQALAYVPHAEPKGTYCYAVGSLLYDADAPIDSIVPYLTLAAADTTYEGRFNTLYILSELAEEQGDYATALDHLYTYTDHLDSLYTAERGVDVQQLVYEYQTQLQVAREHERSQRQLWLTALGALLVVAALVILWLNTRRRKAELTLEVGNLQRQRDEQYRQSAAYIADNERQIAHLKERLNDLGSENSELRHQLERQVEKIEAENHLAQLIITDREELQAQVKGSAVYGELIEMAVADKSLRTEQMQQVEALLDAVYPNFRRSLSVNPSESPFEYQLCLLVRLGLRAADIAVLTSHTPSGISRAKERLYAKLTGNVGKAADFDRYIANLS